MKNESFFILALFLVLTSLDVSAEVIKIHANRPDVPSFVGYVPNEIVVNFASSITSKIDKDKTRKGILGVPLLDQVGLRHNVISVLPQFRKAKKKIYRNREIDLSGWHKIKFSGKVDVKAIVKEYKKTPGVIDAQPIGIHALHKIPNDPDYNSDFSFQWHLNQGNDVDIDAFEAWDIETGNENIVVGILDTGVRYFHRDLGGSEASYDNSNNADGNIWINWAERNGSLNIDDDNNGYVDDWVGYDFVNFVSENFWCEFTGDDCEEQDNDPRDFNGHGTHVAGIVAALNNNDYGTAAPAGGWGNGSLQPDGNGVKIMPLRICWSEYSEEYLDVLGYCRMDFAAEALRYAADNGAKLVNASWGSSNSGGLADAINYFLASGGIIFKSAGNDNNQETDYINSLTDPSVISVAATNSDDCKADFSNYGTWVDISAPGTGIYSSYHYNGDPEVDYIAKMSGTSMASPLALSVAALIWSKVSEWPADQVIQQLYDSVDDIYGLQCNASYTGRLGAGRVNALIAVDFECIDNDSDNYSTCDGDCNDSKGDINPGVEEACDGIDNNCNDLIDEGCSGNYNLIFSTSPNRANPVALDGQTVSGDIYVFTGPDAGVKRVNFSLDGVPHKVENYAPYDFEGTAGGLALPTDTNQLTDDVHQITAVIELIDGSTEPPITATFIVNNGGGPPVDTDGDGVPDGQDLCPGTLIGEPVDANGCSDAQRDVDGDGWEGDLGTGEDCDDLDPAINPDATEFCDGIDNNCNDLIDEGCSGNYNLIFSTSPNRANPVALDGQTVSGDIYVFTGPDAGVKRVNFSLDGVPHKVENYAPYDFEGTAGGLALPTDTNQLTDDVHQITAVIELIDGSTEPPITATFIVNNGGGPPVDTDGDGVPDGQDLCPGTLIGEPVDANGCSDAQRDVDGDGWEGDLGTGEDCDDLDPAINPDATEFCDGIDNNCNDLIDEGCSGNYNLIFSTSPNRANPVALDGQTVSGDIYVFTGPDAGVKRVNFSLDGVPHKVENYAPYDFEGTAGGLALPTDTNQLTDDVHQITAVIELIDGSTEPPITADFTVNN